MATTSNTVPMLVSTEQSVTSDNANNNTNIFASNIGGSNDEKSQDTLRCFVCDAKVHGWRYVLATCRTQTTRSRVIEKLGELVGERYMVVISEDDVICRSCANLVNTFDRLESEMRNVRDNILRFLEQKYSLEEGELLGNSNTPKPCQPPQITKSNHLKVHNYCKNKKDSVPLHTTEKTKLKKPNVWMQCDKCKYTTHYNSFMVHHVRDHIKKKSFCDKCGIQFIGESEEATHVCNSKTEENEAIKETVTNLPVKSTEEALNMPMVESDMVQDIPMMSVQTYAQQVPDQDNVSLMQLSNQENIQLQNIITPDGIATACQPMYVTVLQHVNDNETVTHPSMITDSEAEILMKVKDNGAKQMLTLTDDGNLEMVEVSWNEMQQSTDSHPDIQFT